MMGFGDVLWFLLFALLGLLSVRWSIRLYGTWFSPVSLFIGINCTSICAYHLRLLNMKDVSPLVHMVVFTCMVAFGIGCSLGLGKRDADLPVDPRATIDARGLTGFFYATAGIATAGWVISSLILIARHRGLGVLLANIWLLQGEFQMQGIGYLNLMGILVLPAYMLRRSLGRTGRLDMLLVASAILGLLLAGIKAYVFYSVLAAMGTWAVMRPDRMRPRQLFLLGALLVGFFVAYNAKMDIFIIEIAARKGSPLAHLRSLQWPYLYFVGAWPAMQNIADGLLAPPPVPGAVTFYAFWKVAGDLLGVVKSVPFAQDFTNVGASMFNVYSLFGVLWQEWTWAGAVVVCGLLGFVASRLYLRARRAGYWAHTLVYGLFSYGLSMSCFMYSYRFNEAVLFGYLYLVGFVAARGGVLIDRRGRG